MDIFYVSWKWYIAGPIIGLFVPLLLLIGNKLFGISTSFHHFCWLYLPKKKSKFLQYDAPKNRWKFYFVLGIAIGAFISVNYLSNKKIQFLPEYYYTIPGMIKLFIGGLLVGFGTRYANGCTSGHAITGISILNLASLKSTIAFFMGGVIYTFLAFYIF